MRLHPLANALCLAILAILVWLNAQANYGSPALASTPGLSKSHIHYGWPFSCFFSLPASSVENRRLLLFTPFALNLVIALALLLPPTLVLHGLLRRTLQIHLATASVLMLAAAVLVYLNTRTIDPNTIHFETFGDLRLPWGGNVQYYGWPSTMLIACFGDDVFYPPALAANILTALAILSTLTLLCEKILFRRKISESKAAPTA